MEQWMAYWVDKRSRGKVWYLFESITFFSFAFLFTQWLLLLFRLDSHVTFNLWQPIVTGLFSGWIQFQKNECNYRRYLSEHPDCLMYRGQALTAVNAMPSPPRK
jgi:hypothetical protein